MPVVSESFAVRLVPRALVIVVALVALVPALLVLTGRDDVADSLGGDFPSFYGAGRIVLEGDADDLYDPVVQRAAQAPYHDDPDEFLYFAYPPFVAVMYAGIAWMPYGIALSVHAILALAALGVALRLVVPRRFDGVSDLDATVAATALALVAYPVATAVLGGQNTTFTLLLFAAVWSAIERHRAAQAGIAAAAMLYKPQFGLVLLALIAVARRWTVLAIAAVSGLVIGVLTAFVWGWSWVEDWLDQVQRFGDVNAVVNGPLMINLIGWIGNLSDSGVASAAAVVLAVVVFVVTAAVVWRRGLDRVSLGISTAAVLLVAPSALFYDLGLALVGFGVLVVLVEVPRRQALLIAGAVTLSWTQLAATTLGWSPLFLLLVAFWAYAVVVEFSGRSDSNARTG